MFKDKHFEVKVKKDQPPTGQPMVVHHVITSEEVGHIADKLVSTMVIGALLFKGGTTLLRMAEHVVVTKVK